MFYSGLRDESRIKDRSELRSRGTHRETIGYVIMVHARLTMKQGIARATPSMLLYN